MSATLLLAVHRFLRNSWHYLFAMPHGKEDVWLVVKLRSPDALVWFMFLSLLLLLQHASTKSPVLTMCSSSYCKVSRVKIFQKVLYLMEDLIFQYVFVAINGLEMLIIE